MQYIFYAAVRKSAEEGNDDWVDLQTYGCCMEQAVNKVETDKRKHPSMWQTWKLVGIFKFRAVRMEV